ncbi:MAG: IS1595 family transposase [Gammaproteobacteria bacterium]|nr:MAG: IS1595 family transposase [Gammaproteobacteria bacterium]
MRFPSTLLEFQTQFPDDDHCWTYLRRARWPRGFSCPRCGGKGSHFLASRRLEQCRTCRYQSSVTAGTVFHGTRVPLRVWFLGIFFLARHKKGVSALQFQRDTGVGSYQTAWALLHKLRSGLANLPAPLLKGDVEVDETYIGGHRTGWNGRGAGKEGVAVIVERRGRTAGSARLVVIPRATKEVLTSFVQNAIRPKEATVHTDAWASYTALGKMGIDHRPRKGGHGRHAVDGLPWAHTVFGNLKTWLRGTFHGVSPKHLQSYLDEFVFRFDRRWKEKELFPHLLRCAIDAEPFPYYRLTAERSG